MKRIRLYLLLLVLLTPLASRSQDDQAARIRPVSFFIGVQPGISIPGYDEFGRVLVDINLIPVTLEYAINRHLSIRINSIWDIQVRPEFPTVLATVGTEIALPYYFSLKNSEEGQRGFYVSPVIRPAYHRLNQYYSLGLIAEAGYAILFGRGWSFAIAGQAGIKLQVDPDNPYMRMLPFSAPRLALGYWF